MDIALWRYKWVDGIGLGLDISGWGEVSSTYGANNERMFSVVTNIKQGVVIRHKGQKWLDAKSPKLNVVYFPQEFCRLDATGHKMFEVSP